jgi:DNA-binding response OmpR family regulator
MTKILQSMDCKADILIIDDQPDNLEVLSIILESEGYQVRQASNADVAFKSIDIQVPELIMLDIRMPDIDGYEVCHILKSNPKMKDIPVMFLSALGRGIDKSKAFEAGGVDFIIKPFQLEEVLTRVAHHLTIYRLKIKLNRRKQQLRQQNPCLQTQIYACQQVRKDLEIFDASLKARYREFQVIRGKLKNIQSHY